METEFDRKLSQLLIQEKRFPEDAYRFVSDAVAYTVSQLTARRHVSAAELLDGIRGFAVSEYGAVAGAVMSGWGLKREDDVGTVVYLLIDAGLLRASENDSPADFCTGDPLIPEVPVLREVSRQSDKLPFID